MLTSSLDSAIYFLVQGLVLCLLCLSVYKGVWKRLKSVTAYLSALFLIDGAGRLYVLYRFGFSSRQYYYFYYLTDTVLELAAFLLVCAFFRRACANQAKMWHFVRLFLAFVFILVFAISCFSLSRNYNHLWSIFMAEFEQNLYFSCLVLNTLLYILMQQTDAADSELGLLVCGMGLQFAGHAATYALKYLAPGLGLADELVHFTSPLCTLGMISTWFYALAFKPNTARVPVSGRLVPALAAGQASRRLRVI
jgi:hypothetical protein